MDGRVPKMENSPIGSRVAVLVPCLNEGQTIAQVVKDFQMALPAATIYVFDNDSTDDTAQVARKSGAQVFTEKRRGKGFVVQSMFQQVDADVFVLVDGDNTYPADQVSNLIAPIVNLQADMVVGSRIISRSKAGFRSLNWLGNILYQTLINRIFGTRLTDTLSGYRAMSRRLVKGLPLFLTGFEVETELTIKALERGYQIVEVPVDLRFRPEGSHSKIRIVQDGWQILWTILSLARDYKPLTFFGVPGAGLIFLGLLLGLIPISEYFTTGFVLRFPTAILAVGLVLSGSLLAVIGLILHAINRRFQELEYYIRILITQSK